MSKLALVILALATYASTAMADINGTLCDGRICVSNGPGYPGPGYPGRPPYPPPPPPRPYPPPNPYPPPRPYPPPPPASQWIDCESINQNYNVCRFDPYDVRMVNLVQQHSSAPCQEGYSYGISYDSIWVNHGCRATFEVERY